MEVGLIGRVAVEEGGGEGGVGEAGKRGERWKGGEGGEGAQKKKEGKEGGTGRGERKVVTKFGMHILCIGLEPPKPNHKSRRNPYDKLVPA